MALSPPPSHPGARTLICAGHNGECQDTETISVLMGWFPSTERPNRDRPPSEYMHLKLTSNSDATAGGP